ncbi:ABA4-like family protein [Allopontixanthobacter sp.]|uniref:ABA4-like family protein n=1 Tax=Allopontixanthobacter sp. TaxID=2906452 RepID=UPI002ABB85B7|nr:ABA4-like family protein [Allopontixanthobacter sp.]MDZ4308624.1 ABA4-like family protein [Allopontixanthobacter sp.]
MWPSIFGAANIIALIGWIFLILLPHKPLPLTAVLYLGVGLLCLVYTAGLVALLSGIADAGPGGLQADFSSIDGVRAIFASDGGVTVGWTHYLAFDLFVGLWIVRDADAKGFSRLVQAPILLVTLLAGPAGLLIWLVIRERRARLHGRMKG